LKCTSAGATFKMRFQKVFEGLKVYVESSGKSADGVGAREAREGQVTELELQGLGWQKCEMNLNVGENLGQ